MPVSGFRMGLAIIVGPGGFMRCYGHTRNFLASDLCFAREFRQQCVCELRVSRCHIVQGNQSNNLMSSTAPCRCERHIEKANAACHKKPDEKLARYARTERVKRSADHLFSPE